MTPEERNSFPFAVKVINATNVPPDTLNKAIRDFYEEWAGTHSVQDPVYILGSDGDERIFLRADNLMAMNIRFRHIGALQAAQADENEVARKAIKEQRDKLGVQTAAAGQPMPRTQGGIPQIPRK